MRRLFVAILLLILSLGCKAQGVDSTQIIHKMIIGTWVDVVSPNHIMTITFDTVELDNECWIYKIDIEKPRNGKVRNGQYWFGFSHHNCNEQFMEYLGGIMTDGTYMRFYDGTTDTSLTNSETFVFKRKK